MLCLEHRKELEQAGAVNVRAKLAGYGGGRHSTLHGFLKSGSPSRGDVEDWLAEKAQQEANQEQAIIRATLKWARIAGWAGIAGVVIAAVGVFVTYWIATQGATR